MQLTRVDFRPQLRTPFANVKNQYKFFLLSHLFYKKTKLNLPLGFEIFICGRISVILFPKIAAPISSPNLPFNIKAYVLC